MQIELFHHSRDVLVAISNGTPRWTTPPVLSPSRTPSPSETYEGFAHTHIHLAWRHRLPFYSVPMKGTFAEVQITMRHVTFAGPGVSL